MRIEYNPNPIFEIVRKQEEHEARLVKINEQLAQIVKLLEDYSK